MKKNNLGIIATTLFVVGCGSLTLILSMSQTFGAVQNNLSGDAKLSTNVGAPVIDAEKNAEIGLDLPKDKRVKLYSEMNAIPNIDNTIELSYVYDGQNVTIRDGMLTKEEAYAVANKIMDFVYGYVDESIFTPYEIDKTKYEYMIQRQYGNQNKSDYGVFLVNDDMVLCTIGVTIENELMLTSFARDGLIDLYGNENVIPEEFLVKNWCITTEQRTEIYDEYFEQSKYIVEEVLGLPAITDDYKDVNYSTYFNVTDEWSNVSFGYVLTDGTYVNVFYNRVNQKWNGFSIAGYIAE